MKKEKKEVFDEVKDQVKDLRVIPVQFTPPSRDPTASPFREDSDALSMTEGSNNGATMKIVGIVGGSIVLLIMTICVCLGGFWYIQKRTSDNSKRYSVSIFAQPQPQRYSNSTVTTAASSSEGNLIFTNTDIFLPAAKFHY